MHRKYPFFYKLVFFLRTTKLLFFNPLNNNIYNDSFKNLLQFLYQNCILPFSPWFFNSSFPIAVSLYPSRRSIENFMLFEFPRGLYYFLFLDTQDPSWLLFCMFLQRFTFLNFHLYSSNSSPKSLYDFSINYFMILL